MQQRRLSFLSEFNCEVSHLPGPENVVADSLSRPESNVVPHHPRQSLNSNQFFRLQFQEYLSLRCLSYSKPAQRLKCSNIHQLYLLFRFRTQIPISSVSHLWASSAPWFRRRWEGWYLCQFTIFLIPVYMQLEDEFQEVMFGKVCPKMLTCGLNPAWIVNGARFKPISRLLPSIYQFLDEGFLISM